MVPNGDADATPSQRDDHMDHADNVCTVFADHVPFGDNKFLHWGRVLARTGDQVKVKSQINKEPEDCNLADVYQDEKAFPAATKGTTVADVQAEVVKPTPMVNVGKEQFIVPEAYHGNLQCDQTMCSDIFACNLSRRRS